VDVDNGSLTLLMGRSFSPSMVVGRCWWPADTQTFHLDGSGRENEVLGADGIDHVVGGKAPGLQRLQIQVHLHLALLAAIRIGLSAPSTVANWVRMKFNPKSFNCCSERPWPEEPSCRIGTLDAV